MVHAMGLTISWEFGPPGPPEIDTDVGSESQSLEVIQVPERDSECNHKGGQRDDLFGDDNSAFGYQNAENCFKV